MRTFSLSWKIKIIFLKKSAVDVVGTHNYDGNLASNITHNINRRFSFWKKSFKREENHETKKQ